MRRPAFLAAAAARPPDSSNLRLWVDGRDLDGAGNATLTPDGLVDSVVNKGSLGGALTSSGTTRPAFKSADGAGGKGCLRFSVGGFITHLTSTLAPAAWTFLHDGSGATIYIVGKTSASHIGTFVCTATGGGGSRGVGLRVSTSFRAQWFMHDGGGLRLNLLSANNAFPSGQHHILSASLHEASSPDALVHVNGGQVITGNATIYSAAEPTTTLRIGAGPTGGQALVGDESQVLAFQAVHDATTRAAVEAWLASILGGFPQ